MHILVHLVQKMPKKVVLGASLFGKALGSVYGKFRFRCRFGKMR